MRLSKFRGPFLQLSAEEFKSVIGINGNIFHEL